MMTTGDRLRDRVMTVMLGRRNLTLSVCKLQTMAMAFKLAWHLYIYYLETLIEERARMVFAAETEERSLHVFPDQDTAASYCEGPAVEATIWLFWDDDGAPLEPCFTIPNKRGLFTAQNGLYHLVPATRSAQGTFLQEALEQIRQVVGEFPFTSVRAVQDYLDRAQARLPAPA